MVERSRLTDAIALASQPRECECAIHDKTLRGFMLRIQPGGSAILELWGHPLSSRCRSAGQ